ncbi:MAG: 6-carboxytetrahydropterin synthase [Ignavibacteria bacterium]|nr:6-carboxytetrahydropterin synthase [Ignavibacteria bacterium]
MKLKIAKDFVWNMSHRLPFHKGLCSNIHGHTYKVRITLEGEPDENGMVLDFYDLISAVQPIIDQLDHSFVVDESDKVMIEFLKENNFRFVIVPCTTTSENLAVWISKQIADKFKAYPNIEKVIVRFYETFDSFAEYEYSLR